MEPIITTIAGAVALGAAAGLKDTASKAVTDAYAGLKALIKRKFGEESELAEAVNKLEQKPDSEARKSVLAEEVQAAGADKDAEIVKAAEAVLALMKTQTGNGTHVEQHVSGSGHIFSGTGNVTVSK